MGAAASVAAAPFVDSGPITVAEFKAKGPVGVKIAFVKDFYREFKLTETTTVEDVIRDIIIPATAASNASYIATFLRNNENHYCKRSVSFKPEGDGMITTLTPECTEVLIFSWKMPFHMIVQHIERQLWIKWKNLIYNDDFYWLDIFCCNFHAPETVMEEMNGSLSRAKSALVLVWPEKTLVFNQASSCYLTWYAMENNFHVHFSASEYLGSPMEPDMIEPIDLSQTSSVQRTWIPLMEQALETSGTNLEELLSKVNQFVRNLVQANADKITDRGTVYGVNLAFITEFIRVNNITETMTTGEVVEKIIKPQTALTKETYLFSRLRDKPYFFADLSNGRTVNQRGNELESFAFLSHTWAMPFVHIVSLLHRSCKYVSMDGTQGFERSSFFWIDVFCKNQHIPAPAMDEFHKALTTPGRVIVAMWPQQPIALTRVWCLYEMWCAIHNGLEIRPEFLEAHTPKLATDLQIDLSRATATEPADIGTIMALIEESVGTEIMTQNLVDFIAMTLKANAKVQEQISMLCFNGSSDVLMSDAKSTKKVRDIKIGDSVRTFDDKVGKVVLITCDIVQTPSIEVCEINGLLITPEHPIYNKELKAFAQPKQFLPIKQVALDKIYNFELDVGHTVVINGVGVACLGRPGAELPFDELYGNGWKNNPDRKKWIK